jgi:ABC-2 type transport system ATP-binding protein
VHRHESGGFRTSTSRTLIRLEGRNGSGKSTLLRIAAGALLPSAGRATGRPHAGYVPERFPTGLAFSAREYLRHLSRIHGLSGPAGLAAVDEWLERLGATEYAAAPLRTLSKGMCQKVAIAQALLSWPGLLVLDEAWTGLDQAARGELDAAVRERIAAGGTVMYVDHDPARLAGEVAERWQLADGGVMVRPGAGQPEAARDGNADGGGAAPGCRAALRHRRRRPGVGGADLAGERGAARERRAGALSGLARRAAAGGRARAGRSRLDRVVLAGRAARRVGKRPPARRVPRREASDVTLG